MRSIVCQNCLPEEYRNRTDLHGYWEIEGNIARCANCGYERPYHRRTRSNKINPSQQRSIDKIQAFFDERQWRDEPKELARFEIKHTDYGTLWVSVETSDHPLTMRGGHFHIGPRGAIEVWSVYGTCDDRRKRARHYAKILGGKVRS